MVCIKIFSDISFDYRIKKTWYSSKAYKNNVIIADFSGFKYDLENSYIAEIYPIYKICMTLRKTHHEPIIAFTDCISIVWKYKKVKRIINKIGSNFSRRDFSDIYLSNLALKNDIYISWISRTKEEIARHHEIVQELKKDDRLKVEHKIFNHTDNLEYV